MAEVLRRAMLPGIEALPRDAWDVCFPGSAEGWAYYRACAAGTRIAAVLDPAGLLIAAPVFTMEYRLDTPLQGRSAGIGAMLTRLLPDVMRWPMLGIGSPFAERCHVALRPGLTAPDREVAVNALVAFLDETAALEGMRLIAFKDLSDPERAWLEPHLRRSGYAAIGDLPVAVLDLAGRSEASYLAGLSVAARRDIRRKQKVRPALRIEYRTEPGALLAEIEALYESTRRHSGVHYGTFEDLPPGYFAAVARAMPGRALFVLYWHGAQLLAFNLLLLEPDRVIDKFLGMAYPQARTFNLYAVSWMENVRLALGSGRRFLQTGQTAYAAKLHLGSTLVSTVHLVRCPNRILHGAIRLAAKHLAFERWDPVLSARSRPVRRCRCAQSAR